MAELEWTRDRPREPGVYLHRSFQCHIGETCSVHEDHDGRLYYIPGDNYVHAAPYVWWYGPLPGINMDVLRCPLCNTVHDSRCQSLDLDPEAIRTREREAAAKCATLPETKT